MSKEINNVKSKKEDRNLVSPERRISLEHYVIGFARAAAQAQRVLSTEGSPMLIKEAEFKVNITTDLNMDKDSRLNVRVNSASPAVKSLMNYKEHFGLDMRFLMVPSDDVVVAGGGGEPSQTNNSDDDDY